MNAYQATTTFASSFEFLRNCWQSAWYELLDRDHPYLTPSCRAHMLQNLAVGIAKGGLQDFFPDARFVEQHNQQLAVIPQVAVLGFKKVDMSLVPRSYQTQRAREYYRQSELPGLGLLTRLVCGVKVADDWTSIDGYFLIQPRNSFSLNWALNIEDHIAEIDANQVQLAMEEEPEYFTIQGSHESDDESQSTSTST